MAINVVVKNNNVEKALSIFKRKVKDSNLMYELREREYYKKPSEIKKEIKNKAKARKLTDENFNFIYLYTYKINTPFLSIRCNRNVIILL